MYKKILVPIDGSEHSIHALGHAMESASKWGAALLIVSVIPPISAYLYSGYGSYVVDFDEYEKQLKQIHLKILQDAKNKVNEEYPEVGVSVKLAHGHVPSKILRISEQEDVDLIVMGSRGLSGIKSWFLGSVSKYVVEHCKKPILIVK